MLSYIAGHIQCRLLPDSNEICELGTFMKEKLQSGRELYFVIQEEHQGQHAKQATISSAVIERMIRKGQFKMSKINVDLSHKLVTTEIALSVGPGIRFPISKFPRSLLQDEVTRESELLSSCSQKHQGMTKHICFQKHAATFLEGPIDGQVGRPASNYVVITGLLLILGSDLGL